MSIVSLLISPYTHFIRPACVFGFELAYNLVIVPFLFIIKILVFIIVEIPLKPVNYILLIEDSNYDYWALYRFAVYFTQFLAVSTVFGIMVGYVLGKHLALLKNFKLPSPQSQPDALEVRPRISKGRSGTATSFKPELREFVSTASVYEDDDGYSYTKDPQSDLFDPYMNSTRLTTIAEK